MTMAIWQRTIVDEAGNIQPGATVTVRNQSAGFPLASLKSDRDGTVPLGNPFTADAEGFAQFFVAGGAYQIVAELGDFSRQWDYVAIGTSAETDAGLVPVAPPTVWQFEQSTADASDPGEFRLNNADPSLATQIYVSDQIEAGADVAEWIDDFDNFGSSSSRGTILIFDPNNPSGMFHIFHMTGSVVDGGVYSKLTVTWVAGTGDFNDGDGYAWMFLPTGAAGAVSGPGTVVNNHAVRFDGTTGNAIKSLGAYSFITRAVSVSSQAGATATAEDSGTLYVLFPTPATLTLPAPSATSNANMRFAMFNAVQVGNRTFTISTPSGNFLFPDGTSSATMTLVGFGSSAIVHSDGSNWLVFSDHANPKAITHGRQTISIPAGAMYTPSTAGAAAATTELVASAPINALRTLAFDPNNEEAAFFMIPLPKSWDGSIFNAEFLWTATTGAGDVVWGIELRVFSESDALEQAFGTQVLVVDTLTTAGDMHISGETSGGLTPAGTPAADSVLFGRITREAANVLDTLTADALLLGIRLFIGIDASTDA